METGLYEQLVTRALRAALESLPESDRVSLTTDFHKLDMADRAGLFAYENIRRAIEGLPTGSLPEKGKATLDLLAALLRLLPIEEGGAGQRENLPEQLPDPSGQVLRAILGKGPTGQARPIPEPVVPLLDTVLLTNGSEEPRTGHQIRSEIPSADRIDLIMAFIRRSGVNALESQLKDFLDAGKKLRVLTTVYTGSTELSALERLRELGADIRISYDITSTRLHAKAWLFYRASGFSTALIGSSNLTHSAQMDGLEWNLRVSGRRNPDVLAKFSALFETYWSGGDFVPFDPAEFQQRLARQAAKDNQADVILPLTIRPEPFQERLLEQLEISRERGHHRNLLVAATGTGKTVMAALDYHRLRQRLPRARLLFVAHRVEILRQARALFRQVLSDGAFGELWVQGNRPARFENLFASVQSLSRANFDAFQPDDFDIIIIDEFHHAAAPSYQALLEKFSPVELLGLTATPERSDGLAILEMFDGRIAAELRLWDAIERQYLVPFQYFGVSDNTDLSQISWRRGRGYDTGELTNLYTADDARATLVLKETVRRTGGFFNTRGLGFCVGVGHAEYMARFFESRGVRSVAVTGQTSPKERSRALRDLAAGKLRFIFSVDVFNEGVDLPDVNTLLFLRPTDSPVLFVQQLGRGLRRATGKAACLVLDFMGHHRREFRFDRKLRVLLGESEMGVRQQVEAGFPYLPAGCHLELDPVARERVLENMRQAVPSNIGGLVNLFGEVESRLGRSPRLAEFLVQTDLDLTTIYRNNYCWSDLRDRARGRQLADQSLDEKALRRALGRLVHVEDAWRLNSWQHWVELETPPEFSALPDREQKLLRMLLVVLGESLPTPHPGEQAALDLLWQFPKIRGEIGELAEYLRGKQEHLHPLPADDLPLALHARYSRREILAAFGRGEGLALPGWREGVLWDKVSQSDILIFTFHKSEDFFQPSTMYRDYAISPRLIHWESQNTTREASPTGQRYIHHEQKGSQILLFARHSAGDKTFYFLGPAAYVSHEGERPMAITWRLTNRLPPGLYGTLTATA